MAYLTFDRPDGKRVDVPEESAQEALRAGYKPVSKGQVEAAQHPIQAGLEGAARGLTFGLSDELLPDKKRALLRKQENPVASGVGEVAGALAPAFVGDEANLAGAVGNLAERAIGKGVAGTVARGMTEGTLYGLTPVISDSVLENKPLMSETTAATLLSSAMTGGALSGAFYGGAKLVGAVSKKAAEVAASDTFANAAGKVEKKALEMQLKIDPNDSEWWNEKLFQFGKDEGVFAGNDVPSVVELAGNVKKAKGQRMGAILDFMEKQVPAKNVVDDIENAWVSRMKGIERNPEKVAALKNLSEKMDALRAQGATWQEYADLVSTWGAKSAYGDVPTSAVERQVKNQARIALRDSLADAMEKHGGVKEFVPLNSAEGKKLYEAEGVARAMTDEVPAAAEKPITREMRVEGTQVGKTHPSIPAPEEHVDIGGDIAPAETPATPVVEPWPPVREPLGATSPGTTRPSFRVQLEPQVIDPAMKGETIFPRSADAFPPTPRIPTTELPAEAAALRHPEAAAKPGTVNMRAPATKGPETVNMRGPKSEWTFDPERQGFERVSKVPGMASKYLEANEEFAKALALENIATDALKKPFNWASAGKGAAMGFVFSGGNPVMPAVGMAASMGWHHIEDKLGMLVAGAARKVQEGRLLPRIAEAFHDSVMQRLAVAPELLGPYRNAIAEAAGQGADHLMSAHVTLANSPQGDDYMARMGLSHETPQEYANATEKMGTLHALLSMEDSVKGALSKGAARFAGKVSGAAPEPVRSDRKDFEGRVAALEKIVNDPSTLAGSLPQGLMAHAPGLTIQAGQAAVQAANFLLSKAPKDPDEWKPKALRAPYKASPAEVSRWFRYVDAVEDPLVLLHQLHKGNVTQEAVETTQTLFPNVFAAIQSEVMGKMTALEKPLSYKQRQALADAFGVQMLGISALQAKVIQAMHQTAQQGAGPGAKPSSNDGRQQVSTARNMQTQSQRLEARGGGKP